MAASALAVFERVPPLYRALQAYLAATPLNAGFESLFTAAAPLLARLDVPALHAPVAFLEPLVGSTSVAAMFVMFALAYPLGAVQPWLPGAALRHAWSAAWGFFFVQFVFGTGVLHVLLPAALVYVMLAVTRAVGALRGVRHLVAAFLIFVYLIFRNLARLDMDVKSNGLGDCTLVMVLVIKVYTLAYNLYDGDVAAAAAAAAKKAGGPPPPPRKGGALEAERALATLPSPLEYAGFIFNFSTVFVGPAFEASAYLTAQRQAMPRTAGAAYLASRWLPALWKFVQGLLWLGLAAGLQVPFSPAKLFAAAGGAGAPAAPFPALLLFLVQCIVVSRYQYYACWKLAEGATVVQGFGYRAADADRKPNPVIANIEAFTEFPLREAARRTFGAVDTLGLGYADLPDWEGTCNVRRAPLAAFWAPDSRLTLRPPRALLLQVNALTVEFSTSFTLSLKNWNMHTQSWLERHIFKRSPVRSLSKGFTFLMSAFWHGCVYCSRARHSPRVERRASDSPPPDPLRRTPQLLPGLLHHVLLHDARRRVCPHAALWHRGRAGLFPGRAPRALEQGPAPSAVDRSVGARRRRNDVRGRRLPAFSARQDGRCVRPARLVRAHRRRRRARRRYGARPRSAQEEEGRQGRGRGVVAEQRRRAVRAPRARAAQVSVGGRACACAVRMAGRAEHRVRFQ
jgi:hypothetical protein